VLGFSSDKDSWINHLHSVHGLAPAWRLEECPLCGKPVGNGRLQITKHLARHMEQIAEIAIPLEPDSESESELGPKDVNEGYPPEILHPDAESTQKDTVRTTPTLRGYRQRQFFLPGNGIRREVITADIPRYLGPDALVRPGVHDVSNLQR
jgi:hypothetical protein